MYKYTHEIPRRERFRFTKFKGLCENAYPFEGEFEELEGFSSTLYPVLQTANKRRVGTKTNGKPPCFFCADKVGYVTNDGTLYYGEDVKSEFLSALSEGEKRKCVMLGAIASFFPDKKWYNTATGESGNMEIHKTLVGSASNPVTVTLKFDDGSVPSAYTYSTTEPSSPQNGQLWCSKQKEDGSILAQRYFSSGGCWMPQEKLWYCISSSDAAVDMYDGDYVTVSECKSSEKNIDSFAGSMKITNVGQSSVCVAFKAEIWLCAHICRESSHSYELSEIHFDRNIPDFDFVCASGNRLWGAAENGHEIHASALGAICSWERFDGNESDSWAVEIGSAAAFTGCGVIDSNPVFFKENEIIRIYGSKPSAFSISAREDIGVARGFEDSLATVQGVLYYKGADGVYSWNGSKAYLVSRYIDTECDSCFGQGLGDKYYIVTEKSGKKRMLCYDSSVEIWNQADAFDAVSLFRNQSELFGVRYYPDEEKWCLVSLDRLSSDTDIGITDFTDDTEQKYRLKTGNLLYFDSESSVDKLTLDIKASKGGVCGVFAYENECAIPVTVGYIYGDGKRTVCTFTLPPNVCHSFKVSLSGKGELSLYGISITKSEVQ